MWMTNKVMPDEWKYGDVLTVNAYRLCCLYADLKDCRAEITLTPGTEVLYQGKYKTKLCGLMKDQIFVCVQHQNKNYWTFKRSLIQ